MLAFIQNHSKALFINLAQHISLAFSATLLAILIGLPVGIAVAHRPKLKSLVLSVTSIFQTIPSLALLAFLVPLLGIGVKPTVITLTLYALLPITRNVVTGMHNIPSYTIEAANALGLTHWQRLRLVEIPLALPITMAGIRTATAMTIGITTIAALIGAGGLGNFIIQGLSLDSNNLILLGAIPTALLALVVDFSIANIEITLSPRKHRDMKYKKLRNGIVITFLLLLIGFAMNMLIGLFHFHRHNRVIIATKSFTEQYILGNLMADLIEAKTRLDVVKKFDLGTVSIIQNALKKGNVDLYPEYTGTAYMVVLKHKKILDAQKTYDLVKQEYLKQFQLVWLKPFGFNNSETFAVKTDFAMQRSLSTISDLARVSTQLRLGAPPEFLKRPDGLPGLSKAYGLKFKTVVQLQPDLMYQAIKNNQVEVIEAFTTSGRIFEYQLKLLKDNKNFYPPYYAAPVIRKALLKKYPQIKTALAPLANAIDEKTMQHLNYLVSVKKQSPAKVARDFLLQKKIITKEEAQKLP